MSFEPPAGILDIGNATLRVGKLEVAETTGLNQGLQNIVKNDLLITETDSYTTSKSWGLKLPTTWVAEFDIQGQTGKYVEFNFYNEGSTSNTQGYTLNFKDTSLTLKYDNGSTLATATIPTIVGTFRKVNIFFERGVIAVSIDGARVLYHKESDGFNNGLGVASRVVSTTGGAFLNAFIQSDHGGNSIFKNLRVVNGRFISDKTSNVSFIGSLGVGVNSPKESLDIRGNMHLTRVSNVSQVSVDSNVVTEYTGPHDRPLRKYPEVALTADAETVSGYKGYKVSASSNITSGEAYRAFDGEYTTFFHTQFPYYTENGGVYDPGNSALGNGTPSGILPSHELISGYTGEYITLSLPKKIKMSKISINTRADFNTYNVSQGQSAEVIVVVGSHNGSTWEFVDTHTVGKYPDDNTIPYTFNVNTNKYYEHVGLICTNTGTIDSTLNTAWSMSQLAFYGYEEGSGSLDTTLKTVYNVPATTGTQLEVYYDAKDLTEMPGTVTDLSPNSNGGSVTGATLDETGGIKSFKFDGVNDKINGSITNWTDNQTHTISLWVKFSSLASQVTLFGLWNNASTARNYSSIEYRGHVTPSTIAWYHYANDKRFTVNFVENQWYHISAVYTGSISTEIFYLNGTPLSDFTQTGTDDTILLGTSPSFSLGNDSSRNGYYFNGSIANFRLYSKALNADQVKELYDYQKDYFLGSKSQLTIYKGHLGVGVTEPSGQLELAGDERIQEYPPRGFGVFADDPDYSTHIEGHGVFTAYGSSQNNTGKSYSVIGAFDKTISPDSSCWLSGASTYSGGLPTSSAAKINGVSGEWCALQCPYPIKLQSFTTQVRGASTNENTRMAKSGIIWGSNDGATWYQVHSWSGRVYSDGNPNYFEVNSTEYYSHHAFQATEIQGNADATTLGEWRLFGTPGPTTLDKGSLSLTRSLDVPRVSRYDVDTETPRPEKLVLDLDTTVNSSPTDISGQGNHGNLIGASYSASDKAFKFNGNGDTIYVAKNTNLPTGDAIYTLSCWLKMDSTQTSVDQSIMYFGSAWAANELAGMRIVGGNKVGGDIGSTQYYTTNAVIGPERWYHIVIVKRGTGVTPAQGASDSYMRIYVDGVQITDITRNGSDRTQGIGTVDRISIGSSFSGNIGSFSESVNGCISKPQIYSVALEPSEVRKLYNLGRTGRSMVISDTAVGIGKAPEAQLDVRGLIKAATMHVPGTIVQVQAANMTGDSSTSDKNSGHRNSFVKLNITPRFKNSVILADFKFLVYIYNGNTVANGPECLVRRCVNLNPTNLSFDGVNVYYVSGGHNIHHYAENPNSNHMYISLTEVDTPNTTEEIYYVLAFRPHIHGNHSISIGNGGNQYATVRLMEIAQ